MAALPYMPLYVADYLADAAHLTTAQHGAYLLLIMTYWQRGEALPGEDRKLARIVRMTPDEWDENKDDLAEFFEMENGKWVHGRIESELAKVREKSAKATAAAQRRHNKKDADAMQTQCERTADAQRTQCYTDTDTDTDTEEDIEGAKTRPRSKQTRAYRLPDDWVLSDKNRTYAQGKGFDPPRIDLEAEKFANHFHANGKTMKNWDKAWQNWVLRSHEFTTQGKQSAGNPAKRGRSEPSYADIAANLASRADEAGSGRSRPNGQAPGDAAGRGSGVADAVGRVEILAPPIGS